MSAEQGFIKNVVLDRGFGFIGRDGGQQDLFFHVKNLDASLPFDEQLLQRRVHFSILDTAKGLNAVDVRPAT